MMETKKSPLKTVGTAHGLVYGGLGLAKISSFDQLFMLVKANTRPIMLIGRHGVGKTAAPRRIADLLGLQFFEWRLTHMPDTRMGQLPYVHDGEIRHAVSGDLMEIAKSKKPILWFLDEINRAPKESRKAFFSVAEKMTVFATVDGREVEISLPPGSRLMAAANPTDLYGREVDQLGIPEGDRWLVYEYAPTVDMWVEYAKDKGIAEEVIAFVQQGGEDVLTPPFEVGSDGITRTGSPRSWEYVSDIWLQSRDVSLVALVVAGSFPPKIAEDFAAYLATVQGRDPKNGSNLDYWAGVKNALSLVMPVLEKVLDDQDKGLTPDLAPLVSAVADLEAEISTVPMDVEIPTEVKEILLKVFLTSAVGDNSPIAKWVM